MIDKILNVELPVKILFLDFDGVLNSAKWFIGREGQPSEGHKLDNIDPEAVENLNRIIEQTNCFIVISSSWRCSYSLEEILGFLIKRGLKRNKFIGVTPDLSRVDKYVPRGNEIKMWLNDFSNNFKNPIIVILDDTEEMLELNNRLVKTSIDTGLDEQKTQEVIDKFNKIEL